MDDLNFDDSEEWSAVMVGPLTMGWIGPNTPANAVTKLAHADITILMGDRSFPLSMETYAWMRFASPDERPEKIVTSMLTYHRRFAVPVPVGSLEVTHEGVLAYSTRSVETLNFALSKFFNACVDKIQSDLNALTSPLEVVRKYAELCHYGYPKDLRDALTWRGQVLTDVSRGTKVRVRTVKIDADLDHHSGVWKLESNPPPKSFNALVKHHTRFEYDSSRIFPENVFILQASSDEEYEMGVSLLKGREVAERYLIVTYPDVLLDASFFLCQTGDPLEEWIDGEVLSLEEFAEPSGERCKIEERLTVSDALRGGLPD